MCKQCVSILEVQNFCETCIVFFVHLALECVDLHRFEPTFRVHDGKVEIRSLWTTGEDLTLKIEILRTMLREGVGARIGAKDICLIVSSHPNIR